MDEVINFFEPTFGYLLLDKKIDGIYYNDKIFIDDVLVYNIEPIKLCELKISIFNSIGENKSLYRVRLVGTYITLLYELTPDKLLQEFKLYSGGDFFYANDVKNMIRYFNDNNILTKLVDKILSQNSLKDYDVLYLLNLLSENVDPLLLLDLLFKISHRNDYFRIDVLKYYANYPCVINQLILNIKMNTREWYFTKGFNNSIDIILLRNTKIAKEVDDLFNFMILNIGLSELINILSTKLNEYDWLKDYIKLHVKNKSDYAAYYRRISRDDDDYFLESVYKGNYIRMLLTKLHIKLFEE